MSLIQVSDLSFTYDGSVQPVFEHVSFQIDTAWKLGFTGRNGRGKTTFLNLLQGKYPYEGRISASVEYSYFPFAVTAEPGLALDVVEEIYPDYQYWQLSRELNLLEFPEEALYRPYGSLSNGEQTKLQLAVLFLKENHFLLIDEPTNHLDLWGRELVSRYLNKKRGFILVSHDRAFLDGCVDHILAINKADIQVCKGNFSTWMDNKRRQDAFEQGQNAKLQREIGRLQEAAREKAVWSDRVEATKFGSGVPDRGFVGHRAAKMMARSKAIENRRQAAIQEKTALLKNVERSDALKIFQAPYHSRVLGELNDVSVAYGDRPVCEPVSFTIEQGDRIALQGPNGCGKSSILKLIRGEDIPHTGLVKVGSGLRVSYVCQNTEGLRGRLEDVAPEVDQSLLLAMLAKLDVPRSILEKDLAMLSAGQKKKVLLARSLCQKAHLHIWDEPMNYLDVLSRIQLEELLVEFGPTILFVEHDKAFCEKVATKIVEL